jgi:plasmid stabilization system protein ParE
VAARQVQLHVAAQAELVDAIAYYEARAPGLGEQFYAEARRILSLIAEHPEIGTPIWSTGRRFLLDRFPYAIVYRVLEDEVVRILAVMHLRRRPGYWHRRG